MLRRLATSVGAGLLIGAGLLVAPALAAAAPTPTAELTDGLHRGQGWYDATSRIPEPPLALALVLIGAAAMRLRDRRFHRALAR